MVLSSVCGDEIQQPAAIGIAWAAAVTGIEIIGSLLLLFGRLVRPLAFVFAAIDAAGIVLVHAKAGWFVVGLEPVQQRRIDVRLRH